MQEALLGSEGPTGAEICTSAACTGDTGEVRGNTRGFITPPDDSTQGVLLVHWTKEERSLKDELDQAVSL